MPDLPCPFLDGYTASDQNADAAARKLADHLKEKHFNAPTGTEAQQLEDTSTNS